jgi:hypothetical protein
MSPLNRPPCDRGHLREGRAGRRCLSRAAQEMSAARDRSRSLMTNAVFAQPLAPASSRTARAVLVTLQLLFLAWMAEGGLHMLGRPDFRALLHATPEPARAAYIEFVLSEPSGWFNSPRRKIHLLSALFEDHTDGDGGIEVDPSILRPLAEADGPGYQDGAVPGYELGIAAMAGRVRDAQIVRPYRASDADVAPWAGLPEIRPPAGNEKPNVSAFTQVATFLATALASPWRWVFLFALCFGLTLWAAGRYALAWLVFVFSVFPAVILMVVSADFVLRTQPVDEGDGINAAAAAIMMLALGYCALQAFRSLATASPMRRPRTVAGLMAGAYAAMLVTLVVFLVSIRNDC